MIYILIVLKKEVNDIVNAIDIIKSCNNKEKSDIIKTLERLLKEMKYCFVYPNDIREKFIPELKKNKEFVQANIFKLSDGDYTVDILVNEFNNDIKEKYMNYSLSRMICFLNLMYMIVGIMTLKMLIIMII